MAAIGMVAVSTGLSVLAGANTVTAGFVYLISVLAVAVWQGFAGGAVASILSTVCFNYYFFAPVGTLHIADQENWVALACFLLVATIGSRLVTRERERAAEADSRRREIEALYDLSVELFADSSSPAGLEAAAARALRTIGAHGGGLIISAGGREAGAAEPWVGTPGDLEMHRLLGSAAPAEDTKPGRTWRNIRVPVTVSGVKAGELVAYGTRANQEALKSVARLIGLALERDRLFAEQARMEALRQSDSLKTALLQAVSHDLSTPLTSVRVSIASLRRAMQGRPETSEALELISQETARLHRRIQNLLDLARLESGGARPHREPTPPADLFRAAKESLSFIDAQRRVESRVVPGCPDLNVDPSLALEIMVNLVENAHRASEAAAGIELVARPDPSQPHRVLLEVLDRGRGLTTTPAAESAPGGDSPRKGLGLEIARSFSSALGGAVRLLPREGGGVMAQVNLPACAPLQTPPEKAG